VSAGQGIDHPLVEFVGDEDPKHRAQCHDRHRGEEMSPGRVQHVVERITAEQCLRRQGAGIGHYVDEEEQPDQQRNRAAPVRLDVSIEPVGGHGSIGIDLRWMRGFKSP
jgi:hypothetical protein